jgi:acetyltransferase-like isoleucine patch superfamily enzyme
MLAAGVTVTKNVPSRRLAIGCPAKFAELPESPRSLNRI